MGNRKSRLHDYFTGHDDQEHHHQQNPTQTDQRPNSSPPTISLLPPPDLLETTTTKTGKPTDNNTTTEKTNLLFSTKNSDNTRNSLNLKNQRSPKLSIGCGDSSPATLAVRQFAQQPRKHSHQLNFPIRLDNSDKNKAEFFPQLVQSDRERIEKSWQRLISYHPSFVNDIWRAAVDRSPTIKSILIQHTQRRKRVNSIRSAKRDFGQSDQKQDLRLDDGDDDDSNDLDVDERLDRLTNSVKEFFHDIIVSNRLDWPHMKNECEALGARHKDYSQHGFQPVFFDIFIVCFVDRLEYLIGRMAAVDYDGGNGIGGGGERYADSSQNKNLSKNEQRQIVDAWQKFMRLLVDTMRDGYMRTAGDTMMGAAAGGEVSTTPKLQGKKQNLSPN